MGELPNETIPDAHVPQTEGSQIGDHILCSIVERPDHHCGDDLNYTTNWRMIMIVFVRLLRFQYDGAERFNLHNWLTVDLAGIKRYNNYGVVIDAVLCANWPTNEARYHRTISA